MHTFAKTIYAHTKNHFWRTLQCSKTKNILIFLQCNFFSFSLLNVYDIISHSNLNRAQRYQTWSRNP